MADQLQHFISFAAAIAGARDLEQLFGECVRHGQEMLGVDFSTLMLAEEDGRGLRISASLGFPAAMVGGFVLLDGQGLSTYVFRERRPAVVEDFAAETRFEVPAVVSEFGITSALCVPMLVGDEALGVLIGHTRVRRRFSPEEITLFQALANQTAVAVKNFLRLEEVAQRERLLATVLGAIPHPVFYKDTRGVYLGCNDAFAAYLGRSRDEIVGSTVHDVAPPDLAELYHRADQELLEQGGVQRYEAQVRGYDGRRRDVILSKATYHRPAGTVEGLVGVILDISSLRALERALGESEARYRQLIAHMKSGVAVYRAVDDGEDFVFVDCNRAVEEYERVRREDLIGRSVLEVFPGVREFGLFEVFQRVWRTGEPAHHPVSFYQDGRIAGWRENDVYKLPSGEIVAVYHDLTPIKQAEEELARRKAMFEAIFNAIPDAVLLLAADNRTIREANPAFGRVFGYPEATAAGMTVDTLALELADPGFVAACAGRLEPVELRCRRRDGAVLPCELLVADLQDSGEDGTGRLLILRDVTSEKQVAEERRRMEEKLLHVQKLESLGILAGGIAHDFNNLLMAILGNADLALMELSPLSPARDSIRAIEKASRRAADLCRQMLAYSGKGKFVVQRLDLNRVVQEMGHMLEVSISKKAVLKWNLAEPLPAVEADATQLRQVVMNLIVNASEAIGDRSGIISIATGAMECDRGYLAETYLDEDLPEGQYVYLEVADTGCGMTDEVKQRLFDPFFTTKFTGRGLGMSAVLGIVRGHRGCIKVYSEVGRGTTFKVLLPAVPGSVEGTAGAAAADDEWRGEGTVLLVDDEETVRSVAGRMLERMGFRVLTAEDGRQGLERFCAHADEIVCVLLDLSMPHMDGEQTFRELRRIRPDVRVVMSSGYNEQEVSQQFVGKGLAGFIQKPYRFAALRDVMRKVVPGP